MEVEEKERGRRREEEGKWRGGGCAKVEKGKSKRAKPCLLTQHYRWTIHYRGLLSRYCTSKR